MKRRNFIAGLLGIPAIGVAATKAEACHLCENKSTLNDVELVLGKSDLLPQYRNIDINKVEMHMLKDRRFTETCSIVLFSDENWKLTENKKHRSCHCRILKDRYNKYHGANVLWTFQKV